MMWGLIYMHTAPRGTFKQTGPRAEQRRPLRKEKKTVGERGRGQYRKGKWETGREERKMEIKKGRQEKRKGWT